MGSPLETPALLDGRLDARRAATGIALTPAAAVRYLLERGLVDPRSIVDGELVAADATRRNRNVRVVSGDGRCYLLKQGVGAGGIATVAHEAAMYRRLTEADGGRVARRHLSRCFGYDVDSGILILELFRDTRDLRDYHERRGRFPKRIAAALAGALADVHRVEPSGRAMDDASSARLERPLPWALTLHRPRLEHLSQMSGANLNLVRIIQDSKPLCSALDDLARAWQADALIHGDVKWENCLVVSHATTGRTAGVKLIDWEFAGCGDPCWDVGSALSSYLAFWLWSIPVTGDEPPDRYLELAAFPLARMQPAIRTFWETYVQRMRLDAARAATWLSRAVRYSAARLVQTAYEHMQSSPQLTGNIVCLLQLSFNIMERPREAAHQLLGIRVTAPATA